MSACAPARSNCESAADQSLRCIGTHPASQAFTACWRPLSTPISFNISQGSNGAIVDIDVGQRNSQRLPSYTRVNMRLSRTTYLSTGELTYFLEIYNALDEDNPCCVDHVYVRPNGFGKFRGHLEYDYWLPLLPSFGISWTLR